MYPVIGEPPFEAGGFQETVADPLPARTETPVGAPGSVAGVIADGATEAEELPEEFIAVTVNVTGVPFVNEGKLAVRTSLPTVIGLPTEGVIMYPVIGDPPVTTGAVQETVAELTPGTTAIAVGAAGSVATGVTAGGRGEFTGCEELPTAFIAVTVNVMGLPFVKPSNVTIPTFPTVIGLPTDGVTMYPVIGEPPFDAGGFQETVADPLPATTETPVGAPGAVAGTTAGRGKEAEELPEEFIATTVYVIGVPSLLTVGKSAVRTLPTVIGLPTDGVIMYPVIGEPPVTTGGFQETVVEELPATAEMPVGAAGSDPVGVTADDEEAEELPRAFIATTVNVRAVPFVKPLSVAILTFLTVTGLPTDGVTV
jgi:hypothetical protein